MRRLAIALLLGVLLGYTVGRADASGSAVSSSAGFPPLTTPGVTSGSGLLTEAPTVPPPPPTAVLEQPAPTVAGSATPGVSMSGTTFGAWVRDGLLAWADESHGPAYLAMPWGPGYLVTICGPGGCVTLTSTDAGPDLAMQRSGRIGDLAVGLWESVCGVDRAMGLCPASVVVEHRP